MIENVYYRYTESGDAPFLKMWLSEPETQRWFPVKTREEIDATVDTWIDHRLFSCAYTATLHGEPVAMTVLYLSPFHKLMHQCEFAMVVDKSYRGNGIGGALMKELIDRARKDFNIDWLYLHIYEGNPAINLYQRFEFKEFGRQKAWIKEGDKTIDRILMQRKL